jgi:hypothetical protein
MLSFGQVKGQDTLGGRIIEKGTFAPTNTAQKVGYGAEKVAEMLLPVPSLNKVKAVGTLAKAGKYAAEGAMGGAIGGAQIAASEGKDIAGTAKSALGGAAIGAIAAPALMGAVAMSAQSYNLVRKVLKPTAAEALTIGTGPTGAKAERFGETAKTALPDIYHTSLAMNVDLGTAEKPIEALIDVTKEAKKSIWRQFSNLTGQYGSATVDGNKIADKMMGTMNRRFVEQNPAAAQKIAAKAGRYRREMTVDEAEEYLQSVNAELNTYYAKNKVGRQAAASDPEMAHVVNEASGLRDVLYGKLDEMAKLNPGTAQNLKMRYGALTETQGLLMKRKAVLDRQKPIDLQTAIHGPLAIAKFVGSTLRGDLIGGGEALGQWAASRAFKEAQSNEEMIRKMFRAAQSKNPKKPGYVVPPSPLGPERQIGAQQTTFMGGLKPTPDTSGPIQPDVLTPDQIAAQRKAANYAPGAKPLRAGDLPLGSEGVYIARGEGGTFWIKRKGNQPTRISEFEAKTLYHAGYDIEGIDPNAQGWYRQTTLFPGPGAASKDEFMKGEQRPKARRP